MNKRIKKKLCILISSSIITLSVCNMNIKAYALTQYNKNIKIYSSDELYEEKNEKVSKKVAYITIDDGPSKYTQSIIDILNKYDAKATFFMIDRNMKNYPQQVKNIIENGNSAGFHSVSHDIHQLYKDNVSAKREFDKNKETFYEITNEESNIVRLPYGSKPYTPSESYEVIIEAGYKLWDWDLDTQDWKATPNQIIQNVKDYTRNKDKVVILIHEKKQTVQALDGILKYLTEQGYEMLPIEQNQEPENFWINNLGK